MKVLFVGGPMDGERREWFEGQGHIVRTAIKLPKPTGVPDDFSFSIEEHTYTLKRLASCDIASHSTVKNITEALVKGYHRHRRIMSPEEKHRRKLHRMLDGAPPFTHSQLVNHGKRGI